MRLRSVQNEQRNSCSKWQARVFVVDCPQEDHRSVFSLSCGAMRAVVTELPWTAAGVHLWSSMQVQPWFCFSGLFW